MCDYFRGSNIVKSHKLNNVIVHHCLSVDFIKKVDFGEPEVFQDEFAMGLGKIDEFLDAETPCKQFGPSGVYDATKTNWGNLGKGHPGSRSKDISRTTNTGNWENFARRERGKGKKGNKEMQTWQVKKE